MSHGIQTDAVISKDKLLELKDKPAHVIGAASAEGVAVLRLLLNLGFTNITIHDQRPRAQLRKAFRTVHGAYGREQQEQIWQQIKPVLDDKGCFDSEYLSGIENASLVSLGQGWYLDEDNRTKIVESVPKDALIVSMTSLYLALHNGSIAAITGTNGKSTTTAIVEHILSQSNLEFLVSGNERSSRQFLPQVEQTTKDTLALLEISNRQLLQAFTSPQIAAITSLTPDHLEEHDGWEGYQETKARIFTKQGATDIAIANADDTLALNLAERSLAAKNGRLIRCGIGAHPSPSVTWQNGELIAENVPLLNGEATISRVVVASVDDLSLLGEHNLRNSAIAVAVALSCGVDPNLIAQALRSFEGKSLRLEKLDVIEGVEVWSDLKSTTPEATIAALKALSDKKIFLIGGGSDKGLSYQPLADTILTQGVQVFCVPGSATDVLENELKKLDGLALFERVGSLKLGLEECFNRAASGNVVIVSPAAAGFWSQELQGSSSLRTLIRQHAQDIQETLKK